MSEREIAETPEMIERVARALCANQIRINRRDDTPDLTEDMVRRGVDHAWPGHVGEARVAIEAMREPTAEMTKAGVEFALGVSLSGQYHWSDYVSDMHRRQIDTALAETP